MKKLISVFMAIVFMGMIGASAHAQYVAPIKFIDGVRVVKNGASVYMLDMSRGEYKNIEYFSVQFTGATPYIPTSGATIPFISVGTSNKLPDGIGGADVNTLFSSTKVQEVIEYTPITSSNIVHDSGASRFVYTAKIDPSQFAFVKVDNTGGVTDFKISAILGMSKTGKESYPIYLGTRVYNLTSTTGTSVFTGTDSNGLTSVPQGTRCLLAQNSPVSGVTVLYSEGAETIVTASSKSISADGERPFLGNFQTLRNISIRALGTTTLTVECWTGKPY